MTNPIITLHLDSSVRLYNCTLSNIYSTPSFLKCFKRITCHSWAFEEQCVWTLSKEGFDWSILWTLSRCNWLLKLMLPCLRHWLFIKCKAFYGGHVDGCPRKAETLQTKGLCRTSYARPLFGFCWGYKSPLPSITPGYPYLTAAVMPFWT